MLDIAVAYNRYAFLGYEFLTWLWFVVEKDRDLLTAIEPEMTTLALGNRVVLENRIQEAVESITIKGDDAGLEEGLLALRKGAVVTELNLVYRIGEQEWRVTVKGESFNISNLKTPEIGAIETRDDIEGFLLEKVYLYEKVVRLIDKLYAGFLRYRLSADWNERVLPLLKQWIHE
ncbi:hypothetical protein [Desulfococcus sp.]|uniref:hypothetical protein n=1 Tax=Desulfococcus sp. TaxID=2025834 RepID=UPI003D0E98B2